jgi:hypothetical protein
LGRELPGQSTSFGSRPDTVDPSRFGDPIAQRTAWTPARVGGASFCTQKLISVSPDKMEFRASMAAKRFSLVFVFFGVGGTTLAIITFSSEGVFENGATPLWVAALVVLLGLVFAIGGGWMFYYFSVPIVFDRRIGCIWRGRRPPHEIGRKGSPKRLAEISEIHALQLIRKRCAGSEGDSYWSYELNAVFSDGNRINLVDHGDLRKLRDDAEMVSEFLGRPIWDAIAEPSP